MKLNFIIPSIWGTVYAIAVMIDGQQSRSGNSWCTDRATCGSTSWATRGFMCATGGLMWSGHDNDGRKVPSSGINRWMIYGCKRLASAGIIAARATCVFETGRRSRSRWKYRHVFHRVKARRRWHNAIVLARSKMKCARGRARSRYIFFSRLARLSTRGTTRRNQACDAFPEICIDDHRVLSDVYVLRTHSRLCILNDFGDWTALTAVSYRKIKNVCEMPQSLSIL